MKVLLPVDGSDISLEAVRFVVRMGKDGLALEVVLANVQEPSSLYEMVVAHDIGVLERISTEAGEHALEKAEKLLKKASIPYEREVAQGDPANTLADILERYGCDMVVMGARGQGSLRSAMLGSVSHEMLHATRVPVMIVRLPPEQ